MLIEKESALHEKMTQWRHWLHQHPELSFREHLTSDYIAEVLASHDIPFHRGLAGTGIVATVHGQGEGEVIGLRADIDALPLQEMNAFTHRSQHDGQMHACGHDGHTTMLLGAAVFLHQHNDFSGVVHCIFQPAEEGEGGGRVMVEEGLFDLFPCSAVYGMHNWPGLPAGTFAIHQKAVMAAVDTIYIEVTGKGGHAAMPDLIIDPVLTSAKVVNNLQSIISRNLSPVDAAVISITVVEAGEASNVMPDTVKMKGTLRYFEAEKGERIKHRIKEVVEYTCKAMGAKGEVFIKSGYPATINTPSHAGKCMAAAMELVGRENVLTDLPPSMGAEDFAYLLNACEGAYIWIGNGKRQGGCMLHNNLYDFNDDILPLGASYWIQLVKEILPPSSLHPLPSEN